MAADLADVVFASSAPRGVFLPVDLVRMLGPVKALIYQETRWLIFDSRHEVEKLDHQGGWWAKITVDTLSEWTGLPQSTAKKHRRDLVTRHLLLVTQELGPVDDRSSWYAIADSAGQPMGPIRSDGSAQSGPMHETNQVRSSSDQSGPFFLNETTETKHARPREGSELDLDGRFTHIPGVGTVALFEEETDAVDEETREANLARVQEIKRRRGTL